MGGSEVLWGIGGGLVTVLLLVVLGAFKRARSPSGPVELTGADVVAFLRAGGTFRLSEWLALDNQTREACEAAGVALEADRITTLALAIQDREAALDAYSTVDGGEALGDHLMSRVLGAVGARHTMAGRGDQ